MFFNKKHCVAMLLAGGQGSRLGVLTRYRAKPAVPFGGKYRIIDFPLSNCVNSGIEVVGVLTQYQPLELNSYIGTGASWDLDTIDGGAFVLPPFVTGGDSGRWYSGTANAIYQNRDFIEKFDPDYILVLSGDHIYKMNYARMIAYHKEKQADATIAVLRVPLSEASRFGILNTDEELRVVEFDEKPAQPKNDLASMGIYVFDWKKVRQYLQDDDEDPTSAHDFGRNVLPAMLNGGERMFAYPFSGYWKDVGTVGSLWEANMELLGEHPEVQLLDQEWKIYSRNPNQPPHFIADSARVHNSLISEGCSVYGELCNSILSPGVTVENGATVRDSLIMSGVHIGAGSRVERSVIDENCRIGSDCRIGGAVSIAVLGTEVQVEDGARVGDGDWVEPGVVVGQRGGGVK